MYCDYLESPIGWIEITANNEGICSVYFVGDRAKDVNPSQMTQTCKQQLSEYFVGDRQIFDLSLSQQGTDFQRNVWQQLIQIGYGQIASYSDIAQRINHPKAVRAVGVANGKNSISIIVPCHRVIGANGTLTGYAGGLERKKWLIDHEKQKSD